MSVPRFELLGIQLSYNMHDNMRAAIVQFDIGTLGSHAVNHAKEIACRIHLGYGTPDPAVKQIINDGADWAVGYFEQGKVNAINGGWYHPLYHGLLLCLLLKDRSRIERLCSWAKPTKRPEYKGPLEDEIQLLYLVLASFFQATPAKGFEKLRNKIAASRSKNVKVLSRALDSVAERNDADFAAAIESAVLHHKTKPKPRPDAYFMEDWLPLHANTIYLAGLQLGLSKPEYPPEIMAYLMTPESVGF